MALFAYRAMDADGRVSSGSLDATNAIDLELRLKRLGLDLLTFDSVKRSTAARTRSVTRPELITVLVPQLAVTFKQLVPKLPRETEILIALSAFFVRWWYLILGIPIAAIVGGWSFAKTNEKAQRLIDALTLKLPVVGAIREKII